MSQERLPARFYSNKTRECLLPASCYNASGMELSRLYACSDMEDCPARANANRLGVRHVHFLCMDAAEFQDLDRFDFIYLYNPFFELVVAQVMQNIRTSLCRRLRRLTLVYVHPVCHSVVVESAVLTLRSQRKIQASYYAPVFHDCFIYHSALPTRQEEDSVPPPGIAKCATPRIQKSITRPETD